MIIVLGGGGDGVYVFEEHCNTEDFFYCGKIYKGEIL